VALGAFLDAFLGDLEEGAFTPECGEVGVRPVNSWRCGSKPAIQLVGQQQSCPDHAHTMCHTRYCGSAAL
jgi:hypothetical protein